MVSELVYTVEASEVLPLGRPQKDAMYESVVDSLLAGESGGNYAQTGLFALEYTRMPDDRQPGGNSHLYTATLDTRTDSIDFDFLVHLEDGGSHPGEPTWAAA